MTGWDAGGYYYITRDAVPTQPTITHGGSLHSHGIVFKKRLDTSTRFELITDSAHGPAAKVQQRYEASTFQDTAALYDAVRRGSSFARLLNEWLAGTWAWIDTTGGLSFLSPLVLIFPSTTGSV